MFNDWNIILRIIYVQLNATTSFLIIIEIIYLRYMSIKEAITVHPADVCCKFFRQVSDLVTVKSADGICRVTTKFIILNSDRVAVRNKRKNLLSISAVGVFESNTDHFCVSALE